jgi:hypothetical protein
MNGLGDDHQQKGPELLVLGFLLQLDYEINPRALNVFYLARALQVLGIALTLINTSATVASRFRRRAPAVAPVFPPAPPASPSPPPLGCQPRLG